MTEHPDCPLEYKELETMVATWILFADCDTCGHTCCLKALVKGVWAIQYPRGTCGQKGCSERHERDFKPPKREYYPRPADTKLVECQNCSCLFCSHRKHGHTCRNFKDRWEGFY